MNIHRTAFGLVALKTGHKYSTNILAIGGILIGGSAHEVKKNIFFYSQKQNGIIKQLQKNAAATKKGEQNQSTFILCLLWKAKELFPVFF